jgi:hypothetical protein
MTRKSIIVKYSFYIALGFVMILPMLVGGCMATGWASSNIRVLSELSDPAVDESSGLAISRIDPDLFWTHNDSGDQARLYAFGRDGTSRGTVRLEGVKARDWEDMASVTLDGQPWLIIGDIGDNNRRYKNYHIHMVREPRLTGDVRREVAVKPNRVITFRYPDGSRDAEGLAIDPPTKTIYLVSKRFGGGARIYALALADVKGGVVNVVKPVAAWNRSAATAMDISADGRYAVILTYGDAYQFERLSGESWAEAFNREPILTPMPYRQQGEAICYGSDNRTLYLTSERTPTPLWEVLR